MIAFHYPPVHTSSGVQRSLAFSKYLQENGWSPTVLTANKRAYTNICHDQLKDIPKNVAVKRAFALDTCKHLSLGGRYLDFFALPDRWITWWVGGVWTGLRLIQQERPHIIWSTYPIATAHLIGLTLNKLTGIPWIADFRDSMTEANYPREATRRKISLWIEQKTVRACTKAVFTTPSAVQMYKERYPELPTDKWVLMPNGYNEEIFSEVESEICASKKNRHKKPGPCVLVHSGVIYPSERDPTDFFRALADLKQRDLISIKRLKIVLRATGHDDEYQPIINRLGIEDIVYLEPGVPYRNALTEMFMADGLLIFQASGCNHQVPAKIYEYFRARRPIFALTDPTGDTATTLAEAGITNIAHLNDSTAIQAELLEFLIKLENGQAIVANEKAVLKYSRQTTSSELATLFEQSCRE